MRAAAWAKTRACYPSTAPPLIQHILRQLQPHFPKVAVVTNDPGPLQFLGVELIPDIEPGLGPLMGIASGLRAAKRPWNLVVATDIPTIPIPLVQALLAATPGHRCVVPREPGGRAQPLFGLYHQDLADEILSLLASGERRMSAFLDHYPPQYVPVDPDSLANLNTPADYRQALNGDAPI